MKLRNFQLIAHEKALHVLRTGGKRGFSAPTGSGKSYIQAANHTALHGGGFVTVAPTTEILLGIFTKLTGVYESYVREHSRVAVSPRRSPSGLSTHHSSTPRRTGRSHPE